jgi:hypothetical protein
MPYDKDYFIEHGVSTGSSQVMGLSEISIFDGTQPGNVNGQCHLGWAHNVAAVDEATGTGSSLNGAEVLNLSVI